jgi:hypothetical protein
MKDDPCAGKKSDQALARIEKRQEATKDMNTRILLPGSCVTSSHQNPIPSIGISILRPVAQLDNSRTDSGGSSVPRSFKLASSSEEGFEIEIMVSIIYRVDQAKKAFLILL